MAVSTYTMSEAVSFEGVDPDASEAWWWLGLPIATAVAIMMTYLIAPDFYRERVLPEAYGYLEITHIILPFIGFLVCLSVISKPYVKARPFLMFCVAVFALACLYIAGEECSWGQWIFYWSTPDFWAQLNAQQETNLHNTSYYLNQFPQTLLQFAIVIGGLLLPLSATLRNAVTNTMPSWAILIPPLAIVPVSIMAVLFKILDRVQKRDIVEDWLARPAEATETFFYMFMMFYTIMLARRIRAQDHAS